MIVKICGLRDARSVQAAVAAGADAVGVVFAQSRRQVTVDEARALLAEVPSHVRKVGVFARQTPEEVAAIARALELDAVQLSGGETPEPYTTVLAGRDVWLAAASAPDALADGVSMLVMDAPNGHGYGGTGARADWCAAAHAARRLPVMLAGGLTPETVGAAIAQVQPHGVDVSSGVEVAGSKDPERIAAFVSAARRGST